jgi:hypothetical protein
MYINIGASKMVASLVPVGSCRPPADPLGVGNMPKRQ